METEERKRETRKRYPARSEATTERKIFHVRQEVRKDRGRDSRTLRYGKGIAEG